MTLLKLKYLPWMKKEINFFFVKSDLRKQPIACNVGTITLTRIYFPSIYFFFVQFSNQDAISVLRFPKAKRTNVGLLKIHLLRCTVHTPPFNNSTLKVEVEFFT